MKDYMCWKRQIRITPNERKTSPFWDIFGTMMLMDLIILCVLPALYTHDES